MQKYLVLSAIYGALPGGNQDDAKAFDVQVTLQNLLNTGNGKILCGDATFGDPAPNNAKHFGAEVVRDGVVLSFACAGEQTIDFNVGGGIPPKSDIKVRYATYGALVNGTVEAFEVREALQEAIDRNPIVTCNNNILGDPSPGNTKHFSAVVTRKNVNYYYACQEGQTINFAQGGGTGA